jgi:hypothetical protein
MNGVGLANMGDDIYDDPLFKIPPHHLVDVGRQTFFRTETFLYHQTLSVYDSAQTFSASCQTLSRMFPMYQESVA